MLHKAVFLFVVACLFVFFSDFALRPWKSWNENTSEMCFVQPFGLYVTVRQHQEPSVLIISGISQTFQKKKKKEEKSWKVTFSVFTHCLSSNGPGNYLVRFAWNLWKAKKRQEKAEMKMRSERLKVNWLSEETNQSKTGKGGTGCWNSTGESSI